MVVFDNNELKKSFFSTYNIKDTFENYSNETIDPSLILLNNPNNPNNPNNNNLDFFKNSLKETNISSIYQYNLHVGDIFDD